MKPSLGITVVLVLSSVVALAVSTHGRVWQLPDRHNPFAPLAVADPPNWLTRYKLHRLSDDPALCRSVLLKAGADAVPAPDFETHKGCGWSNALRVRSTAADIGLHAPTVMSCRTAVSLAMWAQHAVQPAATLHLRQPVRRLEHLGSYACRNVNNADRGRQSRHARAEAIDLMGFVLQDGSRITVLRDWRRDDDRGRFLRDVEDAACQWFDVALGPDYNRQHADHFHLERGPGSVCR